MEVQLRLCLVRTGVRGTLEDERETVVHVGQLHAEMAQAIAAGDEAAAAEATDRLMAAITGMLEQIRGEAAPVERYVNTQAPGERPRLTRPGKARSTA